jgi:hypothetical protein
MAKDSEKGGTFADGSVTPEWYQKWVVDYQAAAHSMQAGVAMTMNYDPHSTTPKHLRVGVNSALVETGNLARLLISKGILTEKEYREGLLEMMRAEADRYKQELQARFGPGVNIELI